jgi:Acetyltransferase (GNAT) domain
VARVAADRNGKHLQVSADNAATQSGPPTEALAAPPATPRAAAIPVPAVSPAPRESWASVLQASSEATIFQTPAWLDACCAGGGFEDASRLYETADGRRIVLPMVRPKHLARLRPSRSMPDGWGFGGAIAPGELRPEDVAIVLDDLVASQEATIVKTGPLSTEAWRLAPAHRSPRSRHIVEIGDGFDSLWSDLSSGTRNKIRKAEKGGVEVRWGPASDLVGIHSHIHLRWAADRARRQGVPVRLAVVRAKRDQPAGALAEIARHLGDRCRIGVASIDGVPVASTVMLFHGQHAHYWRSASMREADTSGYANYLVLARALEEAADRGHRFVDLGESGGVRSLIDFKEHFRAMPRPYDVLLLGPRLATSTVRTGDRLASSGRDLALQALQRIKQRRTRRQ